MTQSYSEAKRLNETFGWNIIPMYYFRRDENGNKKHRLIQWEEYKSKPFDFNEWFDEYNNLAIITGKISNLSILDVDSEEALLTIVSETGLSLTDLSNYIVKTTKGYQLFYEYEPNTKTRIGIKDKIDFLNGGISFAHDINDGYEVIKDGKPSSIPQTLKELILDDDDLYTNDESIKAFEKAIRDSSDLPYIKPLNYIVNDFLESGRISKNLKEQLEEVFCTKHYKSFSLSDFSKKGVKHDSILYIGGILASNPTVDKDKVIEFLEKWSIKISKIDLNNSREQQLFRNRIKGILKYYRYDENWKQRHNNLTSIEHQQQSFDFKTWYNPEDDLYYFYDIKTKKIDTFNRPSFKEQVVYFLNKQGIDANIADVDTSKVDRIRETFDPTVNDEFFTDEHGVHYHNNFKRSELLQYFITCEPKNELPFNIKNLLEHLIPVEYERELFLHNLAYHATYMQPAPTCFIFTSIQGTGKNTLLEVILGEIYKGCYLRTEESDMVGRFRDQLKNKLCVFIDEVRPNSSRNSERGSLYTVLKQIVANKTISIESKNMNTKEFPNHSFYVLASNDEIPIKITDESDRRINIVKPNPIKLDQNPWYPSAISKDEFDTLLRNELKDFMAYLASIDLNHRKYVELLDNESRRLLLKESVPVVFRYTNAILKKDIEALYDINHDFAEWFDINIVRDNLPYISAKELKDFCGDLAPKIGKKLRDNGIIYKLKKENGVPKRVYFINQTGSENIFKGLGL